MEADERLMTDLDREMAARRGQEVELDQLQEELKGRDFELREFPMVRGKLGKRTSKLEKKDFELQKGSSE